MRGPDKILSSSTQFIKHISINSQTLVEIDVTIADHPSEPTGQYASLHFIDGTDPHSSYAAVARRGNIFLGVRFSGLTEGQQLGVPGKTYLHARVRSARDQALAEKQDLETGANNVIHLIAQQLALDEAWPGFTFEKIDAERASLHLGMFIDGSLMDDADAVITRIEEASLFRKLTDYVINRAGHEHRIARAKTVAAWMFDQAKLTLDHLKKAAAHHKLSLEAQKEFAGIIEGQLEVVGPHLQQLNAIYHKHQQTHAMTGAG